MLNLSRIIALLSITLITGCASGPSGQSFDSALGEWSWRAVGPGSTHTGNMIIVDETKATYSFTNGRILFDTKQDRGKWQGYWAESGGPNACSDKKGGSNNWGVVMFQFNAAYNEFKGEYDVCGEGEKYRWNGYR